ncbi:MAG: adenylyltransferase/cytidyltransferase family protein [Nanohaloarchaea archaeon]|nr:adenylyltransferase/cytidyltransferase family protein [Candidatus Nanohaloarchaea archaeon]
MKNVMAQGTFDVLHPGHLYYLERSADLGDKLIVVVARDSRVRGRKDLEFSEEERREMLDSLEVVDRAVLGSEGDIYSTVKEVDPDIITLGHDQKHSDEEVKEMAEDATNHKVEVHRIKEREGYSSSEIKG